MSWADHAIKDLLEGNTTIIKPIGNSMKGKVESGTNGWTKTIYGIATNIEEPKKK